MIFIKRKRLILWLAKAYFKRWGKTILAFFILGLVFSLIIYSNRSFIISKTSFLISEERVGLAGAFTIDNLPSEVLDKVSMGLTKVSEDGRVSPSAAKNWEIRDGGRTYIFYLRDDLYFADGQKFTSDKINYGFEDVSVEHPSKNVIFFKLKDSYSPFVVTASRKIFKKNFVGLGKYKITDIESNGDFVQKISLSEVSDHSRITYSFYPTQEALKNAFVLGEVTKVLDINDTKVRNLSFENFKNAKISKAVSEERLVTIFYNNEDSLLSDKRIRKALTYALPDSFKYGKRNFLSFSENSWGADNIGSIPKQDMDRSKELLSESSASSSAGLKLQLKTLPQYKDVALDVANAWEKIGVETIVSESDSIPLVYQAFLGEFFVPKDPDQYMLWHSQQPSNITRYKNLRIDKFLEDGRKTVDLNDRKKIYADFQKYLQDDAPASFLFFPYTYVVERK
ncbi:MAG: ABC transporter substrate-binding protein [Patescibacteria group bacterium]